MQMKCKYHANKLLPGGSGLGAEGEGRGLLSRGPPLSPFLSLLGLPTPLPTHPLVLPTQPGHYILGTVGIASPTSRAPFLIYSPNPVAPDGGDRMLKEEPANLWMGLA